MSAKSNLQAFYTLPTTAFDADEPVSAYRTWTMRENLQHLIDSSGQYLVNWHASMATGDIIQDAEPFRPYASWTFPITIVEDAHPMNFDIRVGGRSDSTGTIYAMLSPIGVPRAPNGEAVDRQWFRTTASVTTTTISWWLSTQWTWSAPDLSYIAGRRGFTVTENSTTNVADVFLARLEIVVDSCDAYAVQLREYP